jgi:hypothetical protein
VLFAKIFAHLAVRYFNRKERKIAPYEEQSKIIADA